MIRHTFGTRLVRDGHDLVLVAELMGHARVETTRGYALPTADQDRQRAINTLPTDADLCLRQVSGVFRLDPKRGHPRRQRHRARG